MDELHIPHRWRINIYMLALMSFQAFNITAFTLGLPALSSQHVMDHQNNGRVHTSHDTYGKSYGCWRKRHHDKTRMSASVDEKVEKIAEVEKGGVEEKLEEKWRPRAFQVPQELLEGTKVHVPRSAQ